MFHLFGRVYLEDIELLQTHPPRTKDENFIVYCRTDHKVLEASPSKKDYIKSHYGDPKEFWPEMAKLNKKVTIYADFKTFCSLQIEYWRNILKNPTLENLYWLHENYLKDMRIKSTSESHPMDTFLKIKSYRPLPIKEFQDIYENSNLEVNLNPFLKDVGIEYLLASHFVAPESKHTEAFYNRINHLSWKQIVQEFFVIRNQLVNALHNNINLALPKTHQVDFSQDIEAQMYANPYLSWMHDTNFRENNTDYIKENYDINIFAELYDNWIKYRRPKSRTPELELELDNLTWITNAIKEANWKLLFEKNLERDFGCIYVDNWLIHKANQLWTGMMYREANHTQSKDISMKMELKEI